MRQKLNARILVIKAADDAASQYMSFMNVIFAGECTDFLSALPLSAFKMVLLPLFIASFPSINSMYPLH